MTKDLQELIDIIKSKALTKERKVEEIKAILSENPELVNAKNSYGEAILHFAIVEGNLEIVKLLLEYGANINYQGSYNDTALHEAITNMHRDIAEYLINAEDINLNLQNKEGKIPLHLAALYGYSEIVRLLIEKKSNFDVQDKFGETALHIAVRNDCLEVSKLLIQHILIQNCDETKPNFLSGELSNYWKGFRDKCTTEIEEMQKYTIGNTSKKKVSLYDFFAENDLNQLALYMNNKDIVKTLNTNDYKEEFPIFASKIEHQVQKGVERKCALDPARNYFSNVRLSSTIPVVREKFDWHMFQEILKYASNAELEGMLLHRNELASVEEAQNSAPTQQPVEDDAVSGCFSCIRIKKYDQCVIL